MTNFLVLSLRLIDRRYHGMPVSEWPPAPGRVFQSLVAGVARGAHLAATYVVALEWLEGLGPPTITAPRRIFGQRLELFVPDNDRDVEGDLANLRIRKTVFPRLIESDAPIVYSWRIHESSTHVDTVREAAEQLYQLGRGVDMAWGLAEVLDEAGLQARLAEHPGDTYRPILDSGDSSAGVVLPCPQRGTLQSLRERFDKQRFFETKEGRVTRTTFEQPPRAALASVVYGAADSLVLFDLVDPEREASLQAWPLREAAQLVTRLRDLAAARLREHAEPHALPDIERALIGRKPDGSNEGPPSERVQVIPLPSIGHEHADEAIRRVAVRIPTKCPLLAERVLWAFSGLADFEEDSGVVRFVLAQSTDQRMLNRYRVTSARWQSKTAVALPEGAQRRRIEPARQRDEAKGAPERLDEESRAARAVMQAVRHAGISEPVDEIRVQREPFGRHGRKAEEFAPGTRFAKERLWHVDLTFRQRLAGPLVIGDGRFSGLGVLAPADEVPSVLVLSIESKRDVDPLKMAHAFRRAALARLERVSGGAKLNEYFTGHKADEEPTERYVEPWHVAFHWDPIHRCLLAIPPHAFRYPEQKPRSNEDELLRRLSRALDGLVELVAGAEGRHVVARASSLDHGRYLESDTTWTSATPYTVTRHRKRDSAQAALIEDALAECHRRKLPAPTVEVLDCVGVAGRGLQGRLRLRFPVRISGPLALGRTAYLGGGLFLPDQR